MRRSRRVLRWPRSWSSTPARMRTIVVLPAPLSPTTPMRSPSSTRSESPSRIGSAPKRRTILSSVTRVMRCAQDSNRCANGMPACEPGWGAAGPPLCVSVLGATKSPGRCILGGAGRVLPFMPRMPDAPSVATELITHSGALRRLARDLVGPSDADDLVQDTAVRALRSPPRAAHGLFSWLATVMRNLAANRRRDDHCRSRREAEVGRNGDGPPADAEASRRDLVRAVTDALWALPEPYQSTLVQRYFEELTPSRIAERSG